MSEELYTADETGFYARLHAAPIRRHVAYGMILFFGAAVLFVLFQAPPSMGWVVFMLALAAASFWAAIRLRRATMLWIDLTEDGLADSSGREIARFEDIVSVHRGVFAFKPSNGFLLKLRQPQPAGWEPGMWWRFGRRVGVGGVVPAVQARYMAETIEYRLAARR